MIPPAIILLGILAVAFIVAGTMRACEEQPEIDHGTEVLKGGVSQ